MSTITFHITAPAGSPFHPGWLLSEKQEAGMTEGLLRVMMGCGNTAAPESPAGKTWNHMAGSIGILSGGFIYQVVSGTRWMGCT